MIKLSIFSCASIRSSYLHMANFFTNITRNTKHGALVANVIIFTSIYIAWAFMIRNGKRKPKIRRCPTRSMSIGALHGGKLALQRLLDYHEAQVDEVLLHRAETELVDLLNNEPLDFMQLQRNVAKLEMSGKEDHAVAELQNAVKKAREERKVHEVYEIEILLVEMLIYKGNFEKAFECECLKHEEISDARRPLYKAIIQIMLGNPQEQVKQSWEEFMDIQRHFEWPPSLTENHVDKCITDFEDFKKAVELLKDDIHMALTKKTQK